MTDLGKRIWFYLNDPATPQRLQHYFTAFSGRAFETFDGGGDRRAVANKLTAEDIVAVSLLGANTPRGYAHAP